MSVELEGDISTSTNSFIRNERTVAEEEFEQQIRVKQESFQIVSLSDEPWFGL